MHELINNIMKQSQIANEKHAEHQKRVLYCKIQHFCVGATGPKRFSTLLLGLGFGFRVWV